MKLEGHFDFRDIVTIDGDRSLFGSITGVQFRTTREPLYEVSYMHNGDAKTSWIEEWRLQSQ